MTEKLVPLTPVLEEREPEKEEEETDLTRSELNPGPSSHYTNLEQSQGATSAYGNLAKLLANNKKWAAQISQQDPQFFQVLSLQQHPKYLWIGCSDSRVDAITIVGLAPGDIFVHRNVANLFYTTDLNALSVLQYAVEYLRVEHVIVCGHYNCGGVRAAISGKQLGLIDNWIHSIKDLYTDFRDALDAIENEDERIDHLCELNVKQQVQNVIHTTIVQSAWDRNQTLTVSGWIYGLNDGRLRDLLIFHDSPSRVHRIYRKTHELSFH